MAINYTISYTFSPGTTISSSQVNTNFSDNANTWTGLEALTKSFSALRVDATPTTTTDVVIKSYVDKLNSYRRPVLQYSSATVVNLEAGINGTSGSAQILFPDGTLRTDSTSSRINCTMSQTAAFSGTAQSGIDTGSVSANTWYSFYAAKVTDSSTNFVVTASLLSPIQANYATLNSRLGTNGWAYLGTLPYGDNGGATTAIPKFIHAGNRIMFYNINAGGSRSMTGLRFNGTAGATSLTWTYASGTSVSSAQVPLHILIGTMSTTNEAASAATVTDSAVGFIYQASNAGSLYEHRVPDIYLGLGLKLTTGSSVASDIFLSGYVDGVLGIGANPLL